jgi:16S rRNA (guanine527-N7)-methyltransferase
MPREAIESLAGPVSEEQVQLLAGYVGLIREGARRLSLMSPAALEDLSCHLVDASAVLSVVRVDASAVADLGSGAGLPGVVVAILRPGARITLVESRRRKAAFLRRVVRRLALENVEVLEERIEQLAGDRLFDLSLARAVGSIEATLGSCLRTIGPGGRLVLFKGPAWRDEAARATEIAEGGGAALEKVVSVDLPGCGRATTFVVFHVKRPR